MKGGPNRRNNFKFLHLDGAQVAMSGSNFKGIYGGLLYRPTQMRFPIRGKRVTCRGSKFTSVTPWEEESSLAP